MRIAIQSGTISNLQLPFARLFTCALFPLSSLPNTFFSDLTSLGASLLSPILRSSDTESIKSDPGSPAAKRRRLSVSSQVNVYTWFCWVSNTYISGAGHFRFFLHQGPFLKVIFQRISSAQFC